MNVLVAIILAMLAGIMNGSYAFPVKSMRRYWRDDLTWLVFSIPAFLIVPWLANWIINSDINPYLGMISSNTWHLLLLAGLSFGIGMILFTLAFGMVGLGISFILNIGVSTVFSTLAPILWLRPHAFLTFFGAMEILAMVIFVTGLAFAIVAAIKRNDIQFSKHAKLGIVCAFLSGLFNAGEGFSYSVTEGHLKTVAMQHHFNALSAANVAWIGIFAGAFAPYFLFFLYRCIKGKAFADLRQHCVSNGFRIIVMAVFYVVCLFIFSESSLQLGDFGAVIAWPLFMIFIVLTSNFWGVVQGEWKHANHSARSALFASIFFMIVAVLILAENGYYHH